MTAKDGGSSTDFTGSTGAGGTPPGMLFVVLAAAAAACAAYLWFEEPAYRELASPALAAAAGLFALVAAWCFGRRSALSERADPRAWGFEQSSAAILMTDDEGRVTNMNRSAAQVFKDLNIGLGAGRVLDALGLSANPEQDAGFARLSGKVLRWRTRKLAPMPGRVWQLDDVTEIIKGHAELQREVTVLQDIFDLMPLGFLSADGEGLIDRCNVTLAGWLGETPAALIGRSLGEFLTDAQDSGELGGVSMGVVTLEPAGEGEPFIATLMQTAKLSKDGTRPLYTRSLLVRDVALDLSAAESTTDDVESESRQAGSVETSADETGMLTERLRWLYHDAPVGIAFVDMDGTLSGCNAAFRRLLGFAGDESIERPFADLIAREDRDDVQGALSKVVMGVGQGAHMEVRLDRADGKDLSVSLSVARVSDAAGETVGLVLHFIDTTEHRNLEVQFTQSQKMQAVGQLAGGVAHDFNNLLTAMIGFSDLLLTRHGPDDPDFADIMQIKQNANRATNLVRQLLAFSRKQKLEPEVMDVTEQLGDLSNLLGRLIGERVDLNMNHGRNLGPVLFDKGQFDQVIINLCVNARDAMPGGGAITISTKAENLDQPTPKGHEILPAGDYVTITVSDSGTGIAKENLERIFEPFFSTKDVGAGTGLGLSTVYGIVHQAEGFIFVDSAIGKGTAFTIYLPVHKKAGEAKAKPVQTTKTELEGDLTGQGVILLVEDEDAVRLFGARALRNKGYEVLEATDGETALDVIATTDKKIDLIISDVVMPGMDGHTLVNLARQELDGVKTILMSGYSEDVFRNGPDMDPDIAFLGKPFTLKGLAAKVKDVLEG
ncbi:PAS domain S-box protein [Thalassospiraceae bacterium LMO-JJ14]|nr:PAS domain S-box protein [Thalassospiraceae bacterium LMO-JJ14]